VTRLARGPVEAGVYHVTTRSAGPAPVFTDDVERTYFCNLLPEVVRRGGWKCRAFCVMVTHYHLLLEVPADALQPGMQRLNWSYARWFNSRHGRRGHLFGERYYSGLVESDGHMLTLLRYLAQNPVVDGLCSRPSDWVWGSYRGCVGLDDRFPFVEAAPLRAYFGAAEDRATALIRQFVGDD
jgi:REP element-mobilizing transposase RayT